MFRTCVNPVRLWDVSRTLISDVMKVSDGGRLKGVHITYNRHKLDVFKTWCALWERFSGQIKWFKGRVEVLAWEKTVFDARDFPIKAVVPTPFRARKILTRPLARAPTRGFPALKHDSTNARSNAINAIRDKFRVSFCVHRVALIMRAEFLEACAKLLTGVDRSWLPGLSSNKFFCWEPTR